MLIVIVENNLLLDQNELNLLTRYLDEANFKRIVKIKNKYSLQESLISYYLAKYLVCKVDTNRNKSNISILRDENGKPYLKDNNLSLFFNISHSENIVAGAITNDCIGVDIEYCSPMRSTSYLKTILSDMESQKLNNNERGSCDFFYELWTAKESYLKAIGLGLSKNMKEVSIIDRSVYDNNVLTPYVISKLNFGRYKFSICSKIDLIINNEKAQISKITSLELLNELSWIFEGYTFVR